MYVRQRLDIAVSDLLWALAACARACPRGALESRIEALFGGAPCDAESVEPGAARFQGQAVSCLSVRTALDLCVEALGLEPGDEVLLTGLTIPDMPRVLRRHGLVPVPLDVDLRTLEPSLDEARRRATARTRVVMIAHLFGARVPLDPWVALARERGWLLFEDCAQSFTGLERSVSHPASDLAFFSFGPIKTATALGGALVRVRDAQLARRVRALRDAHPVASRASFAGRVIKYLGLLALARPALYGALVRRAARRGQRLDDVVGGLARGFSDEHFFRDLRRRPCGPQLALLERRLRRFDGRGIEQRARSGSELRARLRSRVEFAGEGVPSSNWVFPVLVHEPRRVQADLRAAGFDSTSQATLTSIPDARGQQRPQAARFAQQALYVPAYPQLPERELLRLAECLVASVRGADRLAGEPRDELVERS